MPYAPFYKAPQDTDRQYDFRVILIGDPHCGKSNLIARIVDKTYYGTPKKGHISIQYEDIEYYNSDLYKNVRLRIADSFGDMRESPAQILESILRTYDVFMIVFDISNRKSFRIDEWRQFLERFVENPLLVVVGAKADARDDTDNDQSNDSLYVTSEEAEKASTAVNASYIEVSAKTNQNVVEAFDNAIKVCLLTHDEQHAVVHHQRQCCVVQ